MKDRVEPLLNCPGGGWTQNKKLPQDGTGRGVPGLWEACARGRRSMVDRAWLASLAKNS